MLYNFNRTIELNKCNSINVKDDDCHNYWIHENDHQLFIKLLDECIKSDYMGECFELFEKYFSSNMIGMDPLKYREEYMH